jgi:glycosyltransferase involved in cell wall biosynthesis
VSLPRLTILSLSIIHQDARVLRQIEYAAREFEVTVVGWGHLDRDRPHVTMHPVPRVRLPATKRALQAARMVGGRFSPRAFEQWYWAKPDHHQALQAVIASQPHLIHANEAISLPIALSAAQQTGARVLFDAHEYSPDHRANDPLWRLLAQPLYTYLIRRYAPQADAMITVEEHIAQRYAQTFGLQVEVILNAPPYQPLPFRPTHPTRIRMIHHGGAIRERRLETMIEVVALSDTRFTLDFMLLPDDGGYLQRLKALAARQAPGRIQFRDPVPPAEIVRTIHAYDIGLFLLPPVNFSYAMALPNKFFEFIMAGLAVAIGPSPAMAALVRQHGLGVVAPSFEPEDLARTLHDLTPDDINVMKRRALEAAQVLNAEHEMRKLLAIYTRLLTSRP